MKASELRIGNWLQRLDGSLLQVNEHDFKILANGLPDNLHPKPITLTEEWLLKFGFENQGRWFAIMNYPIELYVSPDKMVYIGDELSIGYIEYVHQLQNLYFALTNEELTVNEK